MMLWTSVDERHSTLRLQRARERLCGISCAGVQNVRKGMLLLLLLWDMKTDQAGW